MFDPRFLKLIEGLFRVLYLLSLFFSVIMLILIGINYITSKSKEEVQKVHKKLPLLLFGLILVFLSLTIPKILEMFFK